MARLVAFPITCCCLFLPIYIRLLVCVCRSVKLISVYVSLLSLYLLFNPSSSLHINLTFPSASVYLYLPLYLCFNISSSHLSHLSTCICLPLAVSSPVSVSHHLHTLISPFHQCSPRHFSLLVAAPRPVPSSGRERQGESPKCSFPSLAWVHQNYVADERVITDSRVTEWQNDSCITAINSFHPHLSNFQYTQGFELGKEREI